MAKAHVGDEAHRAMPGTTGVIESPWIRRAPSRAAKDYAPVENQSRKTSGGAAGRDGRASDRMTTRDGGAADIIDGLKRQYDDGWCCPFLASEPQSGTTGESAAPANQDGRAIARCYGSTPGQSLMKQHGE